MERIMILLHNVEPIVILIIFFTNYIFFYKFLGGYDVKKLLEEEKEEVKKNLQKYHNDIIEIGEEYSDRTFNILQENIKKCASNRTQIIELQKEIIRLNDLIKKQKSIIARKTKQIQNLKDKK